MTHAQLKDLRLNITRQEDKNLNTLRTMTVRQLKSLMTFSSDIKIINQARSQLRSLGYNVTGI